MEIDFYDNQAEEAARIIFGADGEYLSITTAPYLRLSGPIKSSNIRIHCSDVDNLINALETAKKVCWG